MATDEYVDLGRVVRDRTGAREAYIITKAMCTAEGEANDDFVLEDTPLEFNALREPNRGVGDRHCWREQFKRTMRAGREQNFKLQRSAYRCS